MKVVKAEDVCIYVMANITNNKALQTEDGVLEILYLVQENMKHCKFPGEMDVRLEVGSFRVECPSLCKFIRDHSSFLRGVFYLKSPMFLETLDSTTKELVDEVLFSIGRETSDSLWYLVRNLYKEYDPAEYCTDSEAEYISGLQIGSEVIVADLDIFYFYSSNFCTSEISHMFLDKYMVIEHKVFDKTTGRTPDSESSIVAPLEGETFLQLKTRVDITKKLNSIGIFDISFSQACKIDSILRGEDEKEWAVEYDES